MKNMSSILVLLIFFYLNVSGQGVPANFGIQAGKKQLKIHAIKIHEPSPASEILLNGETIANAIVLPGTLPVNTSGTTAGYANNYNENCPYTGSTAPDIVYSYTPSGNVIVDIDLCGSSYDTKVFVYQNSYTPGSPFACNDDYYIEGECGYATSLIQSALLYGGSTYYIVIDGYDMDSFGDFILEIREVPSCEWGVDLACPEGALPENEACGDNDNGGCNMAAGNQVWETVPGSGGTFCGTTWASGTLRDSDWFELNLAQAASVTLTADADVQILYGLVSGGTGGYAGDPDCSSITGILPYMTAGPCSESALQLGVLLPGTYWFTVRMDVYNGFPCDNNYWIDFEIIPVSCLPPTDLLVNNITATSANLSWTPGENESSWQFACGLSPLAVPSGAGIASSSSTINPITSLTPDMGYQFYVRADCGGDDFSPWAGPYSFYTTQIPANLPFIEHFETGANNWNLVNGAETNKWVVGTATLHAGTSSSYISNNGGIAYDYTVNTSSVVHMYRDIYFTGGPDGYILNFWWKGTGEDCCDFVEVFLLSTSTTLMAGTLPSGEQVGVNYNLQDNWAEVTINLEGSYTGQTKRLVFSWINDNSDGIQPPVAIDDIVLRSNIFTWTGSISSDWNNAGNWNSAVVPDQFVTAEIPGSPSGGRFPVVGAGMTANCFKINLGPGASVIVQDNGILNVQNP